MIDTIVILHGWGASKDRFTPLIGSLESAGYTVQSYDLPGFGETTEPAAAWNVANYVDWLHETFEREQVTPHIILGHSFGAQLAVRYALRFPNQVKALILTGAASIRRPVTGKQFIRSMIRRSARHLTKIIPDSVVYPFAKRLRSYDYRKLTPVMKQTMHNILQEDDYDKLPGVRPPVLLLWGRNDRQTPLILGKMMEKQLPNATLRVFDNAGHNFLYKPTSEQIQIILEFLKSKLQ